MRTEKDIQVDSELGREFGFTSDKFRAESWLWRIDKAIWLSMVFVVKPNQGHTQHLIRTIHEKGYTVKVPTPMGTMQHIIRKMGFVQTEEDTEMGPCEVWVLNVHPEKVNEGP